MALLNWNIDGIVRAVRKAAVPALHLAGKAFVADVQRKISTEGFGVPSPPNQPPYLQTGGLYESVSYIVHPTTSSVSIIVAHPAAFYLEYGTRYMAPRPILRGTLLDYAGGPLASKFQGFLGARHSDQLIPR